MEIVVGALAFIVIAVLASVWRMLQRNKDPKQQQLAMMFIAASHNNSPDATHAASEIGDFINKQGWDRVEASRRIAHALSLVRVSQPAAYEGAIAVSRRDEVWDKIKGALNP